MRTILFLILLTVQIRAATIAAASGSVADLTTAQTAASNGDTITVPAGDWTWTGAFTVTKNLTFQGAGIDATIIRSAQLLMFDLGTTTSWVKGFTLYNGSATGAASCIKIRGQNVKISSCRMVGTVTKILGCLIVGASGSSIPHPTGVCWNCTFEAARAADCEGDLTHGHKIWANSGETHTLGGATAWFIEDCRIEKVINSGQNMFDHAYGGHTVVRYNTIIDCSYYTHGFNSTWNFERGTRMSEFYGNTIRQEKLVMGDPPFWSYSGTGVVWGNTITGTWGGTVNTIKLDYPSATHTGSSNAATLTTTVGLDASAYVGWTVYNFTDGSKGTVTANTTTTVTATLAGGTDNDWDTSDIFTLSAASAYPLTDQPGTSTDASLWNGTIPPPAQTAAPFYEWSNTLNGADIDFSVGTGKTAFIQSGRDYYNDTVMPGYTPYTYPHPLRSEASIAVAKTATVTNTATP